ncbi:M23 family metallopeptidase [Bauldia sp.]|uniref:M23 family metallopeptidase n=1 Tax=Bauldia sp. TaxID=2575872 RepID=UPI003BA89E8B
MRMVAVVTGLTVATSAGAIELQFPVDCSIGHDCVVQQYFDHDPGAGVSDYRCGTQTYDGHDGTDIRLPTLDDLTAGVDVLAAAPGTVTAVRNDMPDLIYSDLVAEIVADRECGNGLVIDHGDGWETQYCHLKRGSVLVAPGTTVVAGDPLGEIGLSGVTEFPHLDFSVRKDGVDLDPFAPDGINDASCTAETDPAEWLWVAEITEGLTYQPAFVLNVGFANGAILIEEIENGAFQNTRLTTDSPAIVFFGLAINLAEGDVQTLVLTGPDGEVIAADQVAPIDAPQAQYMAFVGNRLSDPWPTGVYRGRYAVIRDGEEIAFAEAETTLE